MELGSTRIKLALVGEDPSVVLAVGSYAWENEFVDRSWTYSLETVWTGIQAAHADLVADIVARYGVRPAGYGAIGVSAMMHGYLAFDNNDALLVPFRTCRRRADRRVRCQHSAALVCCPPAPGRARRRTPRCEP
jgi:sugar (pentulose or hexulose) kinase